VAIAQILSAPAQAYTVTSTADAGAGTLRDAFATAPAGDTVVFAPGLSGQTINLTSGPLVNGFARTLTVDGDIDGNGSPDITIDPGTAGPAGIFNDGGDLTLAGLIVSGGSNGGILNGNGSLTLQDSTVSGNGGFGVLTYGEILGSATAAISGSTIQGNGAGGVINDAASYGSSLLTIANSSVSGNSANSLGFPPAAAGVSTIAIEGGSATTRISDSSISGNIVSGPAGVAGVLNFAYKYGSAATSIDQSQVSQNQGGGAGGLVDIAFGGYATLDISSSTISSNSGIVAGGIVNGAANYSGDVTASGYAYTMVLGSTLSGNTGQYYGALLQYDAGGYGYVGIANSTVSGNTSGSGGVIHNAFYVRQGPPIVSSIFASISGQPIARSTGRAPQYTVLQLLNTTISDNTTAGGAALLDDAATSLVENSIIANTTGGADCVGTLELNGLNLIEDGSCSPALTGDPQLGPLADNGGPTLTQLPAATSPVVNAGDDSAAAAYPLVTDQRGTGFGRFNGQVDLGALELRYDLQLQKSVALTVDADNSGNFSPGDTLTFTLTLTNLGVDGASGIVVSDPLPSGFSLTGNSPSQGSFTDPLWTVGNLAAGASATLDLVATINPTGGYTNVATITAGIAADTEPANNQDSVAVNVVLPPPAADLALSKSVVLSDDADASGGYSVGDTVTFTVTLTNLGPDAASGIQVNDPLPSGFALLGSSTSQGSFADPLWAVGSLAVSASATLDLQARINPTGDYTNLAQILGSSPDDPNPANNTASATVTPQSEPTRAVAVPLLGLLGQLLLAGLLAVGAAGRLWRRG